MQLAARGHGEGVLGQRHAALGVRCGEGRYADAVADVGGARQQRVGQRSVGVVLQQRVHLRVRRARRANALVQALREHGGQRLVGRELVVGVHGDEGLEAAGLLDQRHQPVGGDLRVRRV